MRRFLCVMAATFFLAMGGIWYWTANNVMKFADPDYALWFARKLMLDNCTVGALAIIGDSRAETSIVPKRVGPDVVNFGLTGASLITILEVSRRIVSCPALPKAVVITLDPKRFMGTDMFWTRETKFDLFPLDLEKIRQRARLWQDIGLFETQTPFDIDARLRNVLLKIKFPSYYFGSLIAGRFYTREEINLSYLSDTIKDKGYHYLGHDIGDERIERLALQKHFGVSGFFETYFGEILDLYAMHHIPVYFVSAPFKSTAVRIMSREFKQEYAEYLQKWERTYSNFHVLGDIIPSLPPENFSDTIHLNAMGAAAWSARFGDLLNAAKIDTGAFVPPG